MKARWSCQGDPDPVALLPASQFFAPNILAIKTGFLRLSKGQLISKGFFGVIILTKKPTKFL